MAELVDCSDALEGRGGYDYGERWRRARSGGRERENQGRGRNERVGERCGASHGVVRSIQSDEGRTGRQGGRRWRGAAVRASGTQLLGEGEKTTEEEAGWAACWLGRPARPLGCTGLQVSPGRFSISLFSFSIFLTFVLI